MQAHQKNLAGLEEKLDSAEREKNEIADQLVQGQLTEQQAIEATKKAQIEADRARRQIDNLGSPPSPRTYQETEYQSRSTFFGFRDAIFGKKEVLVTRTDDSAGKVWRENRDTLKKNLESKEQIEDRLQKEAEAKSGQRLSAELAHKRAQKEVEKQEKELYKAEQKKKDLEKSILTETVNKLRHKTIEQLDQAIKSLDIYAKKTVADTFTEQAALLKAAIDEKLLEPLNAEIAEKQVIQTLLAEGVTAIQAKRASLEQGLKDIQEVQSMTQTRMQAA